MFEAYVSSVSSVSDVCCKVFNLNVSKIDLREHMFNMDVAKYLI
jgi:hypothetical protein